MQEKNKLFLTIIIICCAFFCLGFTQKTKTEEGKHISKLLMSGKLDQAITGAKDVLKTDKENQEVRLLLAIGYFAKLQIDEAIIEVKKILQKNANNITANEVMMNALAYKEELDEAFLIAKKILKMDPNSVDAHYIMGGYYKRKNNKEKSIFHFTKAVELDPAKEMTVAENLIRYYVELGECDNARTLAENIFQKVIDRDEKFLNSNTYFYKKDIPSVLYSLSICHARDNNSKDALIFLKRAIKLDKKNIDKAREDQQLFEEFGQSKEFKEIIAEEKVGVTPHDE